MIANSDGPSPSLDDLAEEIRSVLESATLSHSWTVDKVTVLDESLPFKESRTLLQNQ